MHRRALVTGALATGMAARLAAAQQPDQAGQPSGVNPTDGLPRVTDPGERRGDMLYRRLGRTGEMVSAIGLGGSHVAKPPITEAETIRLIHAAVDRGITFMDNSWDYNEGQSELRMGKALEQEGYRNKVFLMTKIDGRTKEEAAKQIGMCLDRLRTDHIDLVQHHEILRYDDPDRIFADGGAMEAVLEAKQQGKIRYIGFTGHKDPHIHLYMLEVAARHGFHFDTVQMPLNVMDAHFRSFAQLVVPRAVAEGIGVLGMKSLGGGDGIILKSRTATPIECLHYALNLPTSVVITGIDKPEVLDQAIEAAKTFQPMDAQQVAAILAKTAAAAGQGEYELFKTTAHFDTTARHAEWLGGETPKVKRLAPQQAG
ncbi:MAG: aldo/keto reductase [Alphaproteobacteria bacterium]|nr:aldo/keto reductase [Alphaproteobacteria bacterium]